MDETMQSKWNPGGCGSSEKLNPGASDSADRPNPESSDSLDTWDPGNPGASKKLNPEASDSADRPNPEGSGFPVKWNPQASDSADRLSQIPSSALSNRIFVQLQDHILKGSLAPGEKLTEQRICQEYQVSRTPVREAFRLLDLYGLIEIVPNRGAYVRGLSPQNISDLQELRKSCEVLAVGWAIQRMTDCELQQLAEAYEFMEFYTMKGDGKRMLAINMSFHELIYKGSHNPMLSNLLSVCQLYARQTGGGSSYTSHCLQQVLEEHRQIYQAFQDRNPQAGMDAMAIHLDNARKRREEFS